MPALDSGRSDFVCQMLKAFVVMATSPAPDSVIVPAPAGAQVAGIPSMKVQVNVSASDADPGPAWWHA